ncbi:MAG: glycosyltransferase [Rikenellaceae bacterium]
MNILFLMGVYPNYGGVEKVSTILANEFIALGYGVSIVSFEQPHPQLAKMELSDKVRLHKLSYPVLSKENIKLLNEIILSESVDILINQWCVPYYVARLCKKAIKGSSCKLISVHHNLPNTNARIKAIEIEIEKGRNRLINRCKKSIVTFISRLSLRYTYSVSNKYVVLSSSFIPIAKKYLSVKSDDKILSITNPITIKKGDNSGEKIKEIIYVGRIEYNQKRTFRLVDIWKEVEVDFPDWKLRIVGDGPDRDDLQKRIELSGLKNIKIDGYQDPFEYYRRASILLLVSEYEGFGLVLAEAMANGVVPIVYGSFQSVYDIIDSGSSGFITTIPYNKMDIVDRLRLLMSDDDLLVEISKKAITDSSKFELKSVVNQWENLFKNI